MKYFAQVCFCISDGTFFQLSKSFDSSNQANSWVVSYLDCFSDWDPIYDISEIKAYLD